MRLDESTSKCFLNSNLLRACTGSGAVRTGNYPTIGLSSYLEIGSLENGSCLLVKSGWTDLSACIIVGFLTESSAPGKRRVFEGAFAAFAFDFEAGRTSGRSLKRWIGKCLGNSASSVDFLNLSRVRTSIFACTSDLSLAGKLTYFCKG